MGKAVGAGILILLMAVAKTAASAPPSETRFWIGETGPTGPLFSGPPQYPFACFTVENGLGQPLVDNHQGIGSAVFPERDGAPDYAAEPIGYSRNCSLRTRVDYFYYSRTEDDFLPLPDPAQVPQDVAVVTLDGRTLDFVVRLERGTINRFIYSIAMLAPFPESLESPDRLDKRGWNGRLVYKFQGGVGIGYWQGKFALRKDEALHYDALSRGYAVAYSTGTRTGTHYNLRLAEETALMVKQHFVATYGEPLYTVGIGGSGGAVQQYVFGQNNPDIIDAGIPQLSYPDMITQTIYAADCELLERYFDGEHLKGLIDGGSRWSDWQARRLVEGLNTNATADTQPWNLSPFAPKPGLSECINGWRGLLALAFNPAWTPPAYLEGMAKYRFPEAVIRAVKWSHWNELGNIYPQDEQGVAPNSWDNVGVQYGLRALVNGAITVREFLDLNACVGGWKHPRAMTRGNWPWNPDASMVTVDPWNKANMNLSSRCQTGKPAPRTTGSVEAMNAAYLSGHVFMGRLEIPLIDLRWYLEPILDMHHAQGSFSARARLLQGQSHADNQLIWVAECSNMDPVALKRDCAFNPTGMALDLIDRWMANITAHPERGVAGNKPPEAVDTCFRGDGEILYAGPDAWSGILDAAPARPCAQAFPPFTTSRMEAGDGFDGRLFKCALKPVETALTDGTYGKVKFGRKNVARLKAIFPAGVCDYSQPDVGLPEGWAPIFPLSAGR